MRSLSKKGYSSPDLLLLRNDKNRGIGSNQIARIRYVFQLLPGEKVISCALQTESIPGKDD